MLKYKGAIIFFSLLVVILGVLKYRDTKNNKGTPFQYAQSIKIPAVQWDLLQKLDYRSGRAPQEVKDLDGKLVKIPGFLVPLSGNYSVLSEFLLVPDAQSCVHVPPPPPNLIVYVKLDTPIPMDEDFSPAWVTGVLRLETSESQHGESAYKMQGKLIEEYSYEE